jgi:hypothetical protein
MAKRGARSAYTEAQWEWVVEKYKQGYSCEKLAVFLGVWPMTVYMQLNRRGVDTRPKELRPLDDFRAEFNALK